MRPPAIPVSVDPPDISVAEGARAAMTAGLSRDPGRSEAISQTTTHEGGVLSADSAAVPASLAFSSCAADLTAEFQAVNGVEDDDGDNLVLGLGSAFPRGWALAVPQQRRWGSRISTSRLACPWRLPEGFWRSSRTGPRLKLLFARSDVRLAWRVDAAGRLGRGQQKGLDSRRRCRIGRAAGSGAARRLQWMARGAARGDCQWT